MQPLSGAQHSVRTDCYTINVRPAKQQCLWNNSYMKAIAYKFHRDSGNEKGNIVFLFIRKSKKDAYGKSMPYTFLGTAHFVNYEGSQPMSIIYRLDYPIPAKYIRTTDTAGVL